MAFKGETVDSIKSIQIRQLLTLLVSFGMMVTSALIIWKALMCNTGSESPVVVLLSESREPGFKRGGILFLYMSKYLIHAGEIVAFNVDGCEIPILHCIIKAHERQDTGEVDVLAKGIRLFNNYGDDRLLYAQGQQWLQWHHIMGRAVGFLLYVVWVRISVTEKPIIKNLFAVLYIFSIISVFPTVTSGQSAVNVLDTVTVGNGDADDTSAFIKAWNRACSSAGESTIMIPKGKTFLVQPTNFAGNCESSHISIVLEGTIIAPEDSEAWNGREVESWLVFQDVNRLTISGDGMLNGRGNQHHTRPSLTISRCQNVELSKVFSTQNGGVNFNISESQNVTMNSLTIENPKDNPNTCGIYVSHSGGIVISNSNITTGDDCISRGDQVYNVSITNVSCGAG